MSGRQLVTAESATDSINTKSAVAACPSGKLPLGGGGFVVPNTGVAMLTVSEPLTGPAGWQATAAEPIASAANWKIIAYAICANTS